MKRRNRLSSKAAAIAVAVGIRAGSHSPAAPVSEALGAGHVRFTYWRSIFRTKADLLREIRQRADRRTGQQEAEQRQIDPWQVQPPQRRGHGR